MADNSELEEALKDTIEAIEKAAAAHFVHGSLGVEVSRSAKRRLRKHYELPFDDAIKKKGRKWKYDKDDVLERAEEVGRLAAFIATAIAILEELIRAGVGKKKGQDISIRNAQKPRVDGDMADLAAELIDCDPDEMKVMWDWCPKPPGKGIEHILDLLRKRLAAEAAKGYKESV
jgi:hypothetical protein